MGSSDLFRSLLWFRILETPPEIQYALAIQYTSDKENMEPQKGGLVQMIFLF